MIKKTLIVLLTFVAVNSVYSQTMTFNSGATESGFTFSGWNAAGGTIWVANLASTASVTKNLGTWDFISFYVGPFVGSNNILVVSNLGDSLNYNTTFSGTHTLNWFGITSITFSRTSGAGASADHDNFVYSVGCNYPDTPMVSYTPLIVCNGDSVQLSISGNLNSASAWHVYTDSCGANQVDSTISSSLNILPTSNNQTYYVRGEDGSGCIIDSTDRCGTVTIPIVTVDNSVTSSGLTITAGAMGATYQWIDCLNGNSLISGANAPSYTATANGSYAVVVTENGCTDTSECVDINEVGIYQINSDLFKVYPNPVNEVLNLDFSTTQNGRIKMYNILGEVVFSQIITSLKKFEYEVPQELNDGIYFIHFERENRVQVELIVLKK